MVKENDDLVLQIAQFISLFGFLISGFYFSDIIFHEYNLFIRAFGILIFGTTAIMLWGLTLIPFYMINKKERRRNHR